MKAEIKGGVAHKIPDDFRSTIKASARMLLAWTDITPLARNEWICWIVSAKKLETRKKRIARARSDLISGKRRPCCWAGCEHR